MKKISRKNFTLLTFATAICMLEPAKLVAQDHNYNPVDFTQPLPAARGAISPIGTEALYFDKEDRCYLAVHEWGWDEGDCEDIDQMVVGMGPDIDTMVISKPVSDGYVSTDDWAGDVSQQINEITESYKESVKAQSEHSGIKIEFVGWKLNPQVDRKLGIMYFANLTRWDGEDALNVSLTIFDRYGYVPFKIITTESDLSAEKLKEIVTQVASSYKAKTGSSYSEFTSGDKVASYGALTVLAGILGVKYGKILGAGVLAIALVFLKKLWFLILVPFVWLWKRFKGTNKPAE